VRALAQSAFVGEDDRPALFFGVFFISGQRSPLPLLNLFFVPLQSASRRSLASPTEVPQNPPCL
jgi:hypothetical protein